MAWKSLLLGTLSGVCFAGAVWAQEEFGDAPDPTYRTLLASSGARHAQASGPQLGPLIDYEADGQPNFVATGDDTSGLDDEDGVMFLGLLGAGTRPSSTWTSRAVAVPVPSC